jgi:hypothetical protein
MTNKDLLIQAMPLFSLSQKEWDLFLNHIEKINDPELLQTLEKIKTNQTRLEVIGNYLDYFADVIDEPIRDESIQISA